MGVGTALVFSWLGLATSRSQLEHAARVRIETVRRAAAHVLEASPPHEQAALVVRLDRRPGLSALLQDPGGKRIAGSLPTAISKRATTASYRPERELTTDGFMLSTRALHGSGSGRRLVLAVRIGDEGGPRRLRAWILAVATAILLVVICAVVLSRELAAGIVGFGRRIDAMAQGSEEVVEAPVTSLDEMAELEHAFNRLWARHRLEQQRFLVAQSVLDRTDQAKSEFLATASHELRTPLNSILGFTQVLLAGIDGPLSEGQEEDLRIVEQCGHHLLALITDILDLSAMESGKMALRPRPTDVVPLVHEAVQAALGQLRGKPLQMSSEMGSEIPLVEVDPKRFRQILQNLLSNAIKHTEQGSITISAATEGSVVAISVRDTGAGIAKEEQETVFQEYKQLGDATKRKVGTGLGLPIVRRLVELHGGTVRLESAPGKGSAFTFTLPLSQSRPNRPGEQS